MGQPSGDELNTTCALLALIPFSALVLAIAGLVAWRRSGLGVMRFLVVMILVSVASLAGSVAVSLYWDEHWPPVLCGLRDNLSSPDDLRAMRAWRAGLSASKDDVPEEQWPEVVRGLRPESVQAGDSGSLTLAWGGGLLGYWYLNVWPEGSPLPEEGVQDLPVRVIFIDRWAYLYEPPD